MQSRINEKEFLALDYFAGGVPALATFTLALDDIVGISDMNGPDTIYPLCFVGAVSYFEAFCRDHFASILNIAPQLILNLSQAGVETRVDPMQILEARDGLPTKIGFIVTERMDFSTSDQVNKLYGHVLRITPFSNDDHAVFATILRDRDILLHHGGIYTSAYIKAESGVIEIWSVL